MPTFHPQTHHALLIETLCFSYLNAGSTRYQMMSRLGLASLRAMGPAAQVATAAPNSPCGLKTGAAGNPGEALEIQGVYPPIVAF